MSILKDLNSDEDMSFEDMLNNMNSVELDEMDAEEVSDDDKLLNSMFQDLDNISADAKVDTAFAEEPVNSPEEPEEDSTQNNGLNELLDENFHEALNENVETMIHASAVQSMPAMDVESNSTPFEDTTTITKGTVFKGDITTDGALALFGKITGNVDCAGKLVVTGVLEGDTTASDFFASNAYVQGDVLSQDTVKLGTGTVVIGNITAKSAVIAGAIKGDLEIDGPVILDGTAVVIGNITSRTLQVNNGAVFEGHCGLTYTEINLDTYFDKK